MVTYEIELELMKGAARVPPEVVVRVGDVGTQVIEATLYNGGVPYVPSGMTARLDILKADGKWVRCSASISGSKVTCTLPSQALSAPGRCRLAHFVLFSGNEKAESTDGFGLVVRPEVDCSDPEEESDYYDGLLTDLYVKWLAYEGQAEEQEEARVAAEAVRKTQETARQNAETQRKAQETARVNAEAQRASEFATLKSQSQSATSAANGAAANANNAATYARSVADNLQSSIVGDEDVAEMRAQIEKLGSMLADSTGDFFYMDGTIYAPSAKASVSGTTVTLGSTCTASGNTITLA